MAEEPRYIQTSAGTRYMILNQCGLAPGFLNLSSGPTPRNKVYRAVKVNRDRDVTKEPDVNKLVCTLNIMHIRREKGSDLLHPELFRKVQFDSNLAYNLRGISTNIVHPTARSFYYFDILKDCEFFGTEFPHISRVGSVYAQPSFKAGMTEDMAMHILNCVIAGLKELHKCRSHGRLCGSHVYACREEYDDTIANFKFGFGSTVVDLNDDLQLQSSPDWRYLPIADVWRWARAPELVGEPDDVASYPGDVWMVGILALELIYSGLRFTSGDEFRQRLREIMDKDRLPNDLVHDHESTSSLFGMIIPMGSSSGGTGYPGQQPRLRPIGKRYSAFVKRCLRKNAEERPSIQQLSEDPYVVSVEGKNLGARFLF